MGVIGHKIWYDLWHNKGRTLLVIMSIAAGVFAIGVIFGMVDQLLTGMDQAHQSVFPSHINIILQDFVDGEVINELKTMPGVKEIEPVNQISVRYKLAPGDKWEIGTLMERPDYYRQKLDLIELREGSWPSQGLLGIERLSSKYYDLPVGSEVIFQVDGQSQSYEISSLVRHPFVQPPQFGGQAHFFTDAAGLVEFGIPDGYFGQLLVTMQDPYSLQGAQELAGEIRSRLGEKGIGVIVTLYQDPEKHWGRMFVEGITLVLQVMAIVALLISVMLVLNTMMAIITQQTDQIGIIKAIGGSSKSIIVIYLLNVLTIGFLALLIALPLSLVFAFFMTQNFLNLFNIDYPDFVYSQRSIIFMILTALLAPVLAALWPVLKGAAMSVREALATYGLGGDFGASPFDRILERLGARYLPTSYAAALVNLFRRKARLVFTLLVLSTAGIMFIVVASLVSSLQFTLNNETSRQKYDVRIGFTEIQELKPVLDIIQSVTGVNRAELWYSRNVTLLRSGERLQDSAGLGGQLMGIPADTAMYKPRITAGRWLNPDDTARVIVLNQETAEKNNVAIGDDLTLDLGEYGDSTWKVVGTYRTVYSSGFVVEPIYAPFKAVADITGKSDQGSQALIQGISIDSLAAENDLSDRLKTAFEEGGIDIDFYTTTARLQARAFADNQYSTVVNILINLSILMASVGGIGLMGSLGISVVERRREIGVMRAVGASSIVVGGIFVMEGILQGLISFLFSVPLAYFLAQPLARLLGQTMIKVDLDYAFSFQAVGIWLIVILVISVLFSLLPAYNATKISVQQSIAYS